MLVAATGHDYFWPLCFPELFMSLFSQTPLCSLSFVIRVHPMNFSFSTARYPWRQAPGRGRLYNIPVKQHRNLALTQCDYSAWIVMGSSEVGWRGACSPSPFGVGAVPFKANAKHRYHIPQQHRATNPAAYDAAPLQRGSLTVWRSRGVGKPGLLVPGQGRSILQRAGEQTWSGW